MSRPIPTRVKICGLTRAQDAHFAVELGADLLGLNLWPRSRRYCPPAVAHSILRHLPPHVRAVGVFVNQPRAEVQALAEQLGLHAVQLHGDEQPHECRGYPLPVVKALQVHGAPSPEALQSWPVEALLLDTPSAGFGGSGRAFAWGLVEGLSQHVTVWLAGGLTPENVGAAIRAVRPHVVDVASGVEVAPGIKDPERLARFIAAARET